MDSGKMLAYPGAFLLTIFAMLVILADIAVWKVSFRESDPFGLLAHAISSGEIVPRYQPVISTETGDIHGVEVLAH